MIKILVVDAHPIIRKGLELVLNATPNIKIVGSLDNGEAIFDFLQKNEVTIIITEIDLPKLNGITVLRRLKIEYPNVKVIMFSAQPEDVYAVNTIKAGASGYVSKTTDILTLNEAIEKVNSGAIYLSNELAQRLAVGKQLSRSGNYYKKLSTREIEVLKLLASGRKNKEIAKELKINEKTVSTYKARLMKKLGVDNIVDLINRANLLEL
ncbi:MAG: response regulator [Oceanihabitans sp.]